MTILKDVGESLFIGVTVLDSLEYGYLILDLWFFDSARFLHASAATTLMARMTCFCPLNIETAWTEDLEPAPTFESTLYLPFIKLIPCYN